MKTGEHLTFETYIEVFEQELEITVEVTIYPAEEHCESQVVLEGAWLLSTKHDVRDLLSLDDLERIHNEGRDKHGSQEEEYEESR